MIENYETTTFQLKKLEFKSEKIPEKLGTPKRETQ